MTKKITKCPYCGSKKGMENKFVISGVHYYDFDGNFIGEEFTENYRFNKTLKCVNCGKQIMKYEDLIEK